MFPRESRCLCSIVDRMEEWVAGTAFEWHCGWEALAMPGRMVRACIPTLTLRDYQWTAGQGGLALTCAVATGRPMYSSMRLSMNLLRSGSEKSWRMTMTSSSPGFVLSRIQQTQRGYTTEGASVQRCLLCVHIQVHVGINLDSVCLILLRDSIRAKKPAFFASIPMEFQRRGRFETSLNQGTEGSDHVH